MLPLFVKTFEADGTLTKQAAPVPPPKILGRFCVQGTLPNPSLDEEMLLVGTATGPDNPAVGPPARYAAQSTKVYPPGTFHENVQEMGPDAVP